MRPERDKQIVRTVGSLITGIGAMLLLVTGLATLFALSAIPTGNIIPGLVALALALVMASTLMSCGTQLMRLRLLTHEEIHTMRLCWTALLLVMVFGGILAFWIVPPLGLIAAFMVLALLAIRPAVIRLSSSIY
jgi:hypothetical protein